MWSISIYQTKVVLSMSKRTSLLFILTTIFIIGIIYFAVIAVTFFLSYKIVFRKGAFDGIARLFSGKAKIKSEEENLS